jgi:hypothetical protein
VPWLRTFTCAYMDVVDFTRWTIDDRAEAFPCRQAYINYSDGLVFWDLEFLYRAIRCTSERRDKRDWLKWYQQCGQRCGLADHIKLSYASMPAGFVGNLTRSQGLYSFFRLSTDVSRNATSEFYAQYLRQGASIAAEVQTTDCEIPLPLELTQSGIQLLYKRGGRIIGLRSWMQALRINIQQAVIRVWGVLKTNGIIDGLYGDADEHSLTDILLFIAYLPRQRRIARAPLPQCAVIAHGFLAMSLTNWLATLIDSYVLDVYPAHHDVHRPPPSLRLGSQPSSRVKVHPEAIWEMMVQSSKVGASLQQIAVTRSSDVHAGGHQTMAAIWINKRLSMYRMRRASSQEGCHHYNVNADASLHSIGEDVLCSIGYTWESQAGCYGDIQFLITGKCILTDEADMYDNIAVLRDANKLERVATYRNLQAISNIIKGMSLGQLNLESFRLPRRLRVKAVEQHERRILRQRCQQAKWYNVFLK